MFRKLGNGVVSTFPTTPKTSETVYKNSKDDSNQNGRTIYNSIDLTDVCFLGEKGGNPGTRAPVSTSSQARSDKLEQTELTMYSRFGNANMTQVTIDKENFNGWKYRRNSKCRNF